MTDLQPTPPSWSALLPRLARYLPAGQFNQLRVLPENLELLDDTPPAHAARTLLQVTRTLEPLHRVLVQYMPRYLIELDPTPGHPHGELIEGSFIFADVTGFTALTELLSRQGQARGRELMNQIMNRLFTEILDPLIASGGDLLIFAGDAALVYFPKQDNHEDVLQAIRAALRMERAIVPFASFETEYGRCSLTMSAGVEHGLAYAGVVGTQQRMELLISGPGIDGAMQAEEQAKPGQVALGQQAQAVANDHFTLSAAQVVDNLGDALGEYEIFLPSRKRGSAVILGMEIPEILKSVEVELQRVEKLAPFLPEDMLAHLVNTDRHRKLISEFRPVAVQFIHIVGLEALATQHGPELATQVFQRYFVRAEEIVTQHEGIISQIDAYAGGFFLLNTFGTPKAHEGTTRYAVSAALHLAKAMEQVNREFELDMPLKQRGGITYGLVFNGEIGAKYRRESVVVGPAVNRAARLMSKAGFSQVILDSEIWEEVHTAFVGERLPSVKLKGIEGQVVIVKVHEMRHGTRLQPLERPLLGREKEQAQLAQALDNLTQKQQGSIWSIIGETGLGKTALILDLAEKARQRDLTILAGRCQPHGKHMPLFVWIDLLTGWLDVDESSTPARQRALLIAELQTLGMSDSEKTIANLLGLVEQEEEKTHSSTALLQTESAPSQTTPKQAQGLNALLGNRLAQAPQKSGKTLWKRLEERITGPQVIIKLLQELVRQQQLLIILEDMHWLDGESVWVLKKLLSRLTDLPITLVLTGREAMHDEHETALIRLSRLDNSAVMQIAQRTFGGRALDPSLTDWICSQAHGNPLFAQELCRALQQADATLLDRETGEVRWTRQAPTLPLSLHALLLARVDELPLVQQRLLRRAAVMGLSMELEGLLNLCQERMSEREGRLALERVVQAGFLTESQNQIYRFSHPLMQEAIYATLSFSQRQVWHTQIGDWLVERQPEQPLELIAYHYLRGSDAGKAAKFARQAGDKAQEQGAYTGALEYYEQILALEDVPIQEKIAAAEGRGNVLALQGDYSAAEQAYAQAGEWGSPSALDKQYILSGDFQQLAQHKFTPSLRAWAAGSRAWLLAQNGRQEAALEASQNALALAEDAAQIVIETLVALLQNGEPLGSYEKWLHQFAQTRLSRSN